MLRETSLHSLLHDVKNALPQPPLMTQSPAHQQPHPRDPPKSLRAHCRSLDGKSGVRATVLSIWSFNINNTHKIVEN